MDATTFLLFVPACFALNLAPGPNNLLAVSNATRFGFASAWSAGIGRLFAFAGMIALAALGLAVVLQASEAVFHVIKFAGAAYLFYLAIQLWRSQSGFGSISSSSNGGGLALARQEFLVAAGNPKAIVIFTAFLPQFVDPSHQTTPQFLTLGALFLLLEFVAIAIYAFIGHRMRRFLAEPTAQRTFNRVCASMLGFASAGLLFARRASSST